MLKMKILFVIAICFFTKTVVAQTCTGLGQTPATAFPVCGTSTFSQNSVPKCGGTLLPVHCTADAVSDVNPYWYKFACFASGTLAFLITPKNINDDYDWQLFDVTNRNPAEVFTNSSLFVACNWSGEPGKTGASSAGNSIENCGGQGVPLFSKMPTLIKDHQYLLLISHFTETSSSGYTLEFVGGSANITDPMEPHLTTAGGPSCTGNELSIKLNKNMKCSSIDANGSDFLIYPSTTSIVGARGVNCTNSFDMDSLVLTLSSTLAPGKYKITVRPNNNLLDNCDQFIPSSDTLLITVYPSLPTPMDSLSPLGCAPDILNLVFRDPIQCTSIARNGSDFKITGTAVINIASAAGICDAAGLTKRIQIKLSSPIQRSGTFLLQLATGADGNTIINQCGKVTLAGSVLPFSTADTVSANFNSTLRYGCKADTVIYHHNGGNGITNWTWNFDNTLKAFSADTAIIYPVFGTKLTTLIVSNGTCSDSVNTAILLDNAIEAAFEGTAVLCPEDSAIFTDKSIGSLNDSWEWNFGNGNSSFLQQPPTQFYVSPNGIVDIPVQLIVTNSIGCSDTAIHAIRVTSNCRVAVPGAFSPNGDGLNDQLYPTNGYKTKDLIFRVFNRIGQLVFETRDWTKKWDGNFKGNPQDTGTYVWLLNYTQSDTGKKYALKGSTVLLR